MAADFCSSAGPPQEDRIGAGHLGSSALPPCTACQGVTEASLTHEGGTCASCGGTLANRAIVCTMCRATWCHLCGVRPPGNEVSRDPSRATSGSHVLIEPGAAAVSMAQEEADSLFNDLFGDACAEPAPSVEVTGSGAVRGIRSKWSFRSLREAGNIDLAAEMRQ